MNLYCYVGNNPVNGLDSEGEKGYFFDGYNSRNYQPSVIAELFRGYDDFQKSFFHGPQMPLNKDEEEPTYFFGSIVKKALKEICSDYCYHRVYRNDTKWGIELFGYSNGGVIALEIAQQLDRDGCECAKDVCTYRPNIRFLGLLDQVKWKSQKWSTKHEIPDNVMSFALLEADPNKREAIFPLFEIHKTPKTFFRRHVIWGYDHGDFADDPKKKALPLIKQAYAEATSRGLALGKLSS